MMTHLELELQDDAAADAADAADANPDKYESALGKAIAYWRSGKLIPLTLANELMAEGYDVGTIEAHHLLKVWPSRSHLIKLTSRTYND